MSDTLYESLTRRSGLSLSGPFVAAVSSISVVSHVDDRFRPRS